MESPSPRNRSAAASVRLLLIIVAVAFGVPWLLHAAAPQWWARRAVINPTKAADDFAVLNLGALKNLATGAFDEFEAHLPGHAGPVITALIKSWYEQDNGDFRRLGGKRVPLPADNYAAVNVGQLKRVAKPFYDRLIQVGVVHTYPWLESTNPADDYAVANIGQAKQLFSFDPDLDTDEDGLTDWAEYGYGTNASESDSDDDGVSDAEEIARGTLPLSKDSDTDGMDDGAELVLGLNPMDPDTDDDDVPDGSDEYPDDPR